MTKWTQSEAFTWYKNQDWIVGCNYLPSNAINQLEMFQPETFDIEINKRELSWANDLGFNSVRVYLHDLLWSDPETCLLYTSPSPRDSTLSRMPSSA